MLLFCAPPAMGLAQRRAMPPFEELWATSMLPGSAVLHGGKLRLRGAGECPAVLLPGSLRRVCLGVRRARSQMPAWIESTSMAFGPLPV